mmetsp:Transcript_84443/g.244109  ORF Transcript_84443/g.244109 Transcript_84443/m.244109 type:complete len:173 (-) Transcript_84443:1174-1692(-)
MRSRHPTILDWLSKMAWIRCLRVLTMIMACWSGGMVHRHTRRGRLVVNHVVMILLKLAIILFVGSRLLLRRLLELLLGRGGIMVLLPMMNLGVRVGILTGSWLGLFPLVMLRLLLLGAPLRIVPMSMRTSGIVELPIWISTSLTFEVMMLLLCVSSWGRGECARFGIVFGMN